MENWNSSCGKKKDSRKPGGKKEIRGTTVLIVPTGENRKTKKGGAQRRAGRQGEKSVAFRRSKRCQPHEKGLAVSRAVRSPERLELGPNEKLGGRAGAGCTYVCPSVT